ncbi:MAG TPA: permease [Bacteroidales bacterium]|nr:permease [Bacteroidales bacterium]
MLQNFADWFVYDIIGLEAQNHWGAALNFFIYDTIKIFLLLISIMIVMGYINSYFPIEKVKKYLTRKKMYGLDYFLAVVLGAVTPFCSCSSIPLFIGFVSGGIPLGVTFAFLISSPLISEIAIAMFWGMFGLKATLIYVASGMALGMFGGWFLGKMKLEHLLTPWVKEILQQKIAQEGQMQSARQPFFQRFPGVLKGAFDIVKSVGIYIVIGVGIGGVIHGLVPTEFFEAYIGKENLFAVPVAVIFGAPMYANPAGVVPIVGALVDKGVPIGTALAFMMSVIAISFPEAMMLKKVMTFKMMGWFFGYIVIAIIISGYLFNFIL